MHAIVCPGCCRSGCHLICGGAIEGEGLRRMDRWVQHPWDTSGYPSHPRGVLCHLCHLYMDDLDTAGCFTWDRVPLFRQPNHSPERSSLSLHLGVSPSPLYSSSLKTCNQLPTCLLPKCNTAETEMLFKKGAGLFFPNIVTVTQTSCKLSAAK